MGNLGGWVSTRAGVGRVVGERAQAVGIEPTWVQTAVSTCLLAL